MNSELLQILNESSPTQLKDLVESIYGINADIDHRIESQLLRTHPKMLAQQLKKRIQSLKRGRKFIDSYQSTPFSRELDYLIDDIRQLLPGSPELAFQISDQFMSTHEKVFQRVDDSHGSVGDSYAYGLELWMEAAIQWQKTGKCKQNWQETLFTYHKHNDYGVWDDLIVRSAELLSEEALRQMVWRFEADFKHAINEASDDGYNFEAATACSGIAAVAQALGDITLYEHSVLLISPQPNELQKQSIVRFCLSVNEDQTALKWLQGTWSNHFEPDRLKLLDKTYLQLNRHEDLLALRRSTYAKDPDHTNLQALLEVIPENEKSELLHQSIQNTLTITDLDSRISNLIAMKAITQAAEQVISQYDQLSNVFYEELLEWAESFEQSQHVLAEAACYRLLLEDILNKGRSKAYHHAADYYQRLAKLDEKISSYTPLSDWTEYHSALQQKHGRKTSFWSRVEKDL